MNRGIETEEGKSVLWHNFYGSERTREDEIIREFEENSKLLRERANGNILYHEILSFSQGHELQDETLFRMVADIGQEYLNERAPMQLAYGVIHRDTDHVHLHLMVSSNAVGKPERIRLSKREFSEIQKRVERFALERFPELAQTKVYNQERARERLKTDAREQAMKVRTHAPSRKESLKNRLHSLFERAASYDELARLAKAEGFNFYQRGKTVGVAVREPDGTERRHRLSTLGVEEHYAATNVRLAEPKNTPERKRPEAPGPPHDQVKPIPETPPGVPELTPLEKEISEILSRAPGVKEPEIPKKDAPSRGKSSPERDRGDER